MKLKKAVLLFLALTVLLAVGMIVISNIPKTPD
jgi:hypothetical protein